MNIRKIKRGPAIMIAKDIGEILANTDINKDSKVLDAGSGCGVLTANLARFVNKVYSYDIRKDFLEIAKHNVKLFGLENVTFRNKDIYNGISEKNLDLITLDLKEPWKVLKHAKKALKKNGQLVAYLPNITQVIELNKKLDKNFRLESVKEVIERNWIVEEKRLRPENMIIGHTGFLVFIRKI